MDEAHSGTEAITYELVPNRSISARGLTMCFAAIASVSLGWATFFALQGLWVPLPFAGLELAALGLALTYVFKRGQRWELVRIEDNAVSVFRDDGSKLFGYAPQWTRVELAPGKYASYPHRLVLSSHGREVEIGAFLNEEERLALANRLKRDIESKRGFRA